MFSLRLRSFIHPPAMCHFACPVIVTTRPHESHDHDFLEIFWIEAGQGLHWLNGRSSELSRGTLVFVRARDCHAFSANSKKTPLRMVNVAFAPRTWMKLRDRYGTPDVFNLSRARPLELKLSDSQLFAARSALSDLAAGRVDLLATDRFLLNIVRLAERGTASSSEPIPLPSWLRRTLAALSDSSAEIPINTRELCRRADRSPEHVARVFQRVLKQTPTDFLNNVKLANAATRLISGDDSILQIALAAGFENLGHFYTLFRKNLAIHRANIACSNSKLPIHGGPVVA